MSVMDSVLNKLEATAISTTELGENKTNYESLYKNWGKLGSQDERRQKILDVQKSNRNTKLDKYRGILELVHAVDNNKIFKSHNKAYYKPSIYVAGFNKAPSYSQVLMMSEWLVEKPCDFDVNWVVVPSPKGTRTLVVASNGSTKLFTKYGHFILECRTALPGGNPCNPKSKSNCCVLDCFYQKKGNLLYVLDILAWNSQPMTDGELEFRDYWLRSQFLEMDNVKIFSKKNELSIHLLPKVSCSPESFNRFMMEIYFNNDCTNLDGLLFFHKKAHYFSGETPLVGWLYPFMVPEVLGNDITVNEAYMIQKPNNYTNQSNYISEFNKKMESKKSIGRRNSTNSSRMDTTDVVQAETAPKDAPLKLQSDNKNSTESMEAEAASNSTEKAAPLLVTMEAENLAETDQKTLTSTEVEIRPATDKETLVATDAITLATAMDTETVKEENSKV